MQRPHRDLLAILRNTQIGSLGGVFAITFRDSMTGNISVGIGPDQVVDFAKVRPVKVPVSNIRTAGV